MLILVDLVLVIPFVKHFCHRLIVHVGNKFSLELLLHPINQVFVLEEVAPGQVVRLLDLVDDLFALERLELGKLLLSLLLDVLLPLFCSVTGQLATAVLSAHGFLFVRISRVGGDRRRIRLFEAEVILALKIVHLVLPIVILVIHRLLPLSKRFFYRLLIFALLPCGCLFFPAFVQDVASEELFFMVQFIVVSIKSGEKFSIGDELDF